MAVFQKLSADEVLDAWTGIGGAVVFSPRLGHRSVELLLQLFFCVRRLPSVSLADSSPFLNDEAVFKLLFLAIRNAKVHWKRPIVWTYMLVQIGIFFRDVCPPNVNLNS